MLFDLTLCSMEYFMDIKALVGGVKTTLSLSKISPDCSYELNIGTNVPCYLSFLNLSKNIRKLSEKC